MELVTLLFINTGFLLGIFVLIVLLWAFMPSRPTQKESFETDENEIDSIRHQVEREGEQEAEEELMPYKPPRLDKPGRKRI